MRSTQQEMNQYDVRSELQTEFKALFESKLALWLLENPSQFTSVQAISKILLSKLEKNSKEVIDIISRHPETIKGLGSPFFGSCYTEMKGITSENMLEKMQNILTEGKDLKQILQVHWLYINQLYDKTAESVAEKNNKLEFVKQIFPSTLFNNENRARIEIKEEKNLLTDRLGIVKNSFLSKKIASGLQKKIRAIDRLSVNKYSTFFKNASKKKFPIVCGPSGHTGSLMLGAKLYGNLTQSELQEYAIAAFAFYVSGGNHSFYEVMLVAEKAGVKYDETGYEKNFPKWIVDSKQYKALAEEFDFLSETTNDVNKTRLSV